MVEVERSVAIHVFNYLTHTVVVHITHAPVGDIVPSWAEPTADGGEMLRTWGYHHTLDHAWKSVQLDRELCEAVGDVVTVWQHDCT